MFRRGRAEEKDATSTGAGFGIGRVGGIAMDMETHFACVILDAGVRMCGGIVEQVVALVGV